jgi:hypothetical protein
MAASSQHDLSSDDINHPVVEIRADCSLLNDVPSAMMTEGEQGTCSNRGKGKGGKGNGHSSRGKGGKGGKGRNGGKGGKGAKGGKGKGCSVARDDDASISTANASSDDDSSVCSSISSISSIRSIARNSTMAGPQCVGKGKGGGKGNGSKRIVGKGNGKGNGKGKGKGKGKSSLQPVELGVMDQEHSHPVDDTVRHKFSLVQPCASSPTLGDELLLLDRLKAVPGYSSLRCGLRTAAGAKKREPNGATLICGTNESLARLVEQGPHGRGSGQELGAPTLWLCLTESHGHLHLRRDKFEERRTQQWMAKAKLGEKSGCVDVGDTDAAVGFVAVPLNLLLELGNGSTTDETLIEWCTENFQSRSPPLMPEAPGACLPGRNPKPESTKLKFRDGWIEQLRQRQLEGVEAVLLMLQAFDERYILTVPMGKRSLGESSLQCALRETAEETGLDIENDANFSPLCSGEPVFDLERVFLFMYK